MNFFSQVRLGISSYGDAHQLIFKHKLWLYLIAPGIINIVVFIVCFLFISSLSNEFVEWALNSISAFLGYPELWSESKGVIVLVITIVIKLAFIFFYLSIYKYIILILMSPLLALLSERVEFILNGNSYPFNMFNFLHDVVRGIALTVRNIMVELILLMVLFIIGFIPVLNFATPFLAFYISSYYYGFSMLDYSNERKRFTIKQSIHFIRMQRGVAFGNGAVFYGLLFLPFIGWLIAPAYSVTAAAIAREKLKG